MIFQTSMIMFHVNLQGCKYHHFFLTIFFSPDGDIYRGILKIHRRWLVQTYRCRATPSLPRAGPIGEGNAMGGTMEMENAMGKCRSRCAFKQVIDLVSCGSCYMICQYLVSMGELQAREGFLWMATYTTITLPVGPSGGDLPVQILSVLAILLGNIARFGFKHFVFLKLPGGNDPIWLNSFKAGWNHQLASS